MRIGCHAVLFAERIKKDTKGVLDQLASTGAEGVEIGARFFDVEENQLLKQELSERGLELSGYHMMTNLTDWLDNPQKCEDILQKGAEFLQIMPNKNIIMTGMVDFEKVDEEDFGDARLVNETKIAMIAKAIDAVAARLWKEYGVRLHYHNHSWEWKHQARIYRILLEQTQNLFFAMDLGWTAISGFEPMEWIKKKPNRFCYFHLRDYKKESRNLSRFAEIRESYVTLGEGDMNYAEFMNQVKPLLPEHTWLIVEYETGEVNASRYQKAISKLKTL